MKFLRPGFWQKFVMGLILLAEFAFLVYVLVAFLLAWFASFNLIWALAAVILGDIAISIYIILSNTEDTYKLAWVFLVGCLPILGAVFYFLLAQKETTPRQKKKLAALDAALHRDPTDSVTSARLAEYSLDSLRISNYIERASGSGIYSGTSVEYFSLGDEAFPAMLRELRAAKHYIFIEFFIIATGHFWDSILKILVEKVKEGVDVRVVYDDAGSLMGVPMGYDKQLRAMGIKAHVFSRFKPIVNVKMNNRDHRKIMVIDGHSAFTGGINLADEYINERPRFGHWKDNAILVKGKAVYGFTLLFLSNWLSMIEPGDVAKADWDYYRPSRFIDEVGGFPADDGFVQPYGDIPFDKEAVGEKVYLSIIQRSKKYLYMTTPYLIIDSEMKSAIVNAAEQGVEVVLLTPHIPDKKTVFQITRSYYGSLLSAGVKIYEYTPGFVHEKMFVADDVAATVGTINLDYRSLFLHLECGAFIAGSHSIRNMKQDFLDTISLSHEVTYEEWLGWRKKKKISWAILSLLAPLL